MANSMAQPRRSHLVPPGEDRGFDRQAKAGLQPRAAATAALEPQTFTYGESIWEVLVKGHGSVKATAITMGNRDRSLLRREVVDGSLTILQLFSADDRALAAFGEFLTDNFGDSKKTKAQIAREKLPEILAAFMDLLDDKEKA